MPHQRGEAASTFRFEEKCLSKGSSCDDHDGQIAGQTSESTLVAICSNGEASSCLINLSVGDEGRVVQNQRATWDNGDEASRFRTCSPEIPKGRENADQKLEEKQSSLITCTVQITYSSSSKRVSILTIHAKHGSSLRDINKSQILCGYPTQQSLKIEDEPACDGELVVAVHRSQAWIPWFYKVSAC